MTGQPPGIEWLVAVAEWYAARHPEKYHALIASVDDGRLSAWLETEAARRRMADTSRRRVGQRFSLIPGGRALQLPADA
jgi:hypothetical protein